MQILFLTLFLLSCFQVSAVESQLDIYRRAMPWAHSVHFETLAPKTERNPNGTEKSAEALARYINFGLVQGMRGESFPLDVSQAIPHSGIGVRLDSASEIILTHLASRHASSASLKVADIGCGGGHLVALMPYISNGVNPLTIFALDGVSENISTSQGRKRYVDSIVGPVQNVTHCFRQALIKDLCDIPEFLEGEAFDMITCQNVLHLMSPLEKIRTLDTLYRRLKPGGTLFLSHFEFNLGSNAPCDLPDEDGVYAYSQCVDSAGNFLPHDMNFFQVEEGGDLSPQEYLILENDAAMCRLTYPEVTKLIAVNAETFLYSVTEKVSPESLIAKCCAAGIRPQEVSITRYAFDRADQTTFAQHLMLVREQRDAEDLNSFLITIHKPLESETDKESP